MSNAWIKFPHPNSQATIRLFCLPYAGGGTSIFRLWPQHLPVNIELCPIALPGREVRMKEAPIAALDVLIEQLAEAMIPYLDKPFAIFGHSMGSIIAYELAKTLEEKGFQPVCLFVSGSAGPHVPERIRTLHLLPDEEFVRQMSLRYNAIPDVFLNDKALMAMFLSILRADIQLLETYTYQEAKKLNCPLFAFGSYDDPEATLEHIETWREHTHSSFTSKMFSGDHFYLNSHRELLLNTLQKFLNTAMEEIR